MSDFFKCIFTICELKRFLSIYFIYIVIFLYVLEMIYDLSNVKYINKKILQSIFNSNR